MIAAALLVAAVPAALPPARQASPDQIQALVQLVERRVSGDSQPPVSLPSATLELAPEPGPGAPALSERIVGPGWGMVEIGGRPIHVVLGRTAEDVEALDVAWIDLDSDGRFGERERLALKPSSREIAEGEVSWSENVEGLEVESGGTVFPITLSYFVHPKRGTSASILFANWHEARVTADGREMVLALIDGDHDGCLGSSADRWFLFPADAAPIRPVNTYAVSAFEEGRFQDGRRYSVKPEGCAQAEVTATSAAGPDPGDQERHRKRVEDMWSKRFDAEREGFVAQRELDLERPLATEPIQWRYVSYEEALALGVQQKKPVFIDVMAFWCSWCYRLDYYTYVDAEVAKLLNESYVPVKIIQEQAIEGDYELVREKLEARGIPAMGIFTGAGELLHKISGWKKPEDFLDDLRAGLTAFESAAD